MSDARPHDLPDFGKPPLVETVLSLQFEALTRLTSAHVGLLWRKFSHYLPHIEEHPPLASVSESFHLPAQERVRVSVQDKFPAPRAWFLNEEKSELIQAQPDRFIRNWRKRQSTHPYPRYEAIRAKFLTETGIFKEFLSEESIGELRMNQCEVTYTNHIETSGIWESHNDTEAVFRNWKRLDPSAFLPQPENISFHSRYVMSGPDGNPLGRLHAVVEPVWKRLDRSPMFSLSLTARGTPLSEGIEGAFAFFDLGREWIVKGFAELTTQAMHHAWERKDA